MNSCPEIPGVYPKFSIKTKTAMNIFPSEPAGGETKIPIQPKKENRESFYKHGLYDDSGGFTPIKRNR